ncbi:MAG: 8-amino-7-oxononanoate synthase, partial [Microcystis panniformis]
MTTNIEQTLTNLSSQQKLQLIEQLRRKTEKANSSPVDLVDFSNFTERPVYKKMKQQIIQLEAIGFKNPYFKINQGIAKNTTKIDGQE